MRLIIQLAFSATLLVSTQTFSNSDAPDNLSALKYSAPEQQGQQQIQLSDIERRWIAQNGPVRVAAALDIPPFESVDINGQPVGIDFDLLNLLEQRTGLSFEIYPDNWSNNLEKFHRGELQLISNIFYTPQRDEWGFFTRPYHQVLEYVFAHQSVSQLPFEQLENKVVAIPRNYAAEDKIKQRFSNMTILYVDDLSQAIEAVLERKADLLFDSYLAISYHLAQDNISQIVPVKSMRSFGKTPVHMLISPREPVLADIVQKGLDTLTKQQLNSLYNSRLEGTLLQDYNRLANQRGQELTPEQRDWLKQHQEIRFSADPNWLPYEGLDSEGNFIGIGAEIIQLLQSQIGVKLTPQLGQSWQQSLSAFQDKQVDVISLSRNAGQQLDAKLTNSYLSSPVVMVMRDDAPYAPNIDAIANQRLVMIRDYGYSQRVSQDYPNLNYLYVDNLDQGLTAVSVGQADVLLATLAQVSYQMDMQGINNLRIVGDSGYKTELVLAVQPELAPLVDILNQALANLPAEQKQQIIDRWGNEKYAEKIDYWLIAKIIAVSLACIALIVFWYQRMLREVRARQAAEAQHQALIDLLPIQVMVIDEQGQIISANPQTTRDHQQDEASLIKAGVAALFSNPQEYSQLQESLRLGQRLEKQLVHFNQAGESRAMLLSAIPIDYRHSQAHLLLAVDINERLEMERATLAAKNAAISANQAKSTFLANMSHEIRTPMNAILGFTELLFDQLRDAKQRSYVKTIRSAGSSLLLLINDVLDLSKIEAGKIQLSPTPCNTQLLLEDIGEIFTMNVKAKSLDLLLDIDSNVPPSLLIDEVRLRQILFNLIGNAIKFTDEGYIKVIAFSAQSIDQPDAIDLHISVIDTGIGIDSQELEHIFDSFQQAHSSDQAYGGSGLGLSISRHFVELMNGQIAVNSQPGKGSQFHLIFRDVPISGQQPRTQSHSNAPLAPVDFAGARVLVVDDITDNRVLLQESLPNHGLIIDIAEDGEQAISKAQSTQYDAVLTDIRMPKLNGFQAAQVIKKLQPKVPIIAITASVLQDDYERAKRMNFDGFLRKPVLQKDVVNELRRHLPCKPLTAEVEAVATVQQPMALFDPQWQQPLISEFLEECQMLDRSNNINQLQQFAERLADFARRHSDAQLAAYCDKLLGALECLDVLEIKQLQQQLLEALQPHLSDKQAV